MKIHTKILGSVALAALLMSGFSGCSSDSDVESDVAAIENLQEASDKNVADSLVDVTDADKIPFGDGSFSPYELVAVFPTVKDANGALDHTATYAKVAELANTFAKHVANVDEPTDDPETFKSVNWILGGTELPTTNSLEDADVAHHILAIPTKLPIDPDVAMSPANTKKVKVVEVCNSGYAGQALGVKKVGGDDGALVPNGVYHNTALPCEVTIHNDEDAIYVNMLNPETIFTLFFTEVFSAVEMENTNFQEAMMALPTQVKGEITAMIYNAFDEAGETYTKTAIKMGTVYSSMSKVTATTDTANGGKEPYRHYIYSGDGTTFTSANAKTIAENIITVMTSDEEGTVGVQESALLEQLPSTIADKTPAWRSGRLEPLKVPGTTANGASWIIEACSPTYAKEALSTGEFHTAALPCEIAVFVDPNDNTKIEVSILNPEFMFEAMFADGLATMTADEVAGFNTIISNINGDLKKIVDYAMENNVTVGNFDGTNTKHEPIAY